jgi:deoxyribodipyrimidine photo-lyase
MKEKINIIWFDYDLRVHDHEGLWRAKKSGLPTLGIYILNPDDLENQSYGFPKIGPYRLKFIDESLTDLKDNLAQMNVQLHIFINKPRNVFKHLIDLFDIDTVYAQKAYGSEEIQKHNEVETLLQRDIIDYYDQKPLYHIDDLPMKITELPDIFTIFRQKIEINGQIRKAYPVPQKFESLVQTKIDDDRSRWNHLIQPNIKLTIPGGESNALKRVNHYFYEKQKLKFYKLTRNQMLHIDDSSKLSPYLALGCLSPRYVYEQIQHFESTIIKNISTYWLYFELVWRDYFHYIHVKYKNKIFFKNGLYNKKWDFQPNEAITHLWQQGKTGYPLVDANMIELKETGWMSNRGRQNVANFFVKYIKQDWRFGAAWFEYLLIDYDVSSNYGNWQYQAGLGVDPREDRLFDVTWQGEKYDQDTRYLRKWLPEFAKLPKEYRYNISNLSDEDQERYNFIIGKDYPKPICGFPAFRRKKKE